MFATRPATALYLFALRSRWFPTHPSLIPALPRPPHPLCQQRHVAPCGENFSRCWSSKPAESRDGTGYVLPEFDFSAALEDMSTMDSSTEDPEPVMPGPEDCCQAGCVNCVWNIYNDRHRRWVARQKGEEPPEDPFEKLERELAKKAAARRAEANRAQAAKRNTAQQDAE